MKIKGHTKIVLTDVKTGKVEVHEDDNLITKAVQEYFRNCGLLNAPNVDQNNLVEELLGGVMAFNGEIDEDSDIIHVPAGLQMIANGSVGTINNGNPTEMGSYSSTESGWQSDGRYVQVYDYSTSQGNGAIACVCLTGKNYGYAGEGNTTSQVAHETKKDISNLQGSVNEYSGVVGEVFGYDLSDSSLYALDLTNMGTTGKGILRKYRVPVSKINLKGTKTAPIVLSETEITLPEQMVAATKLKFQAFEGKLLIWNFDLESNHVWGTDFTQYLWTMTKAGVITSETLLNTSGDELHGIQNAIFDGNYIFFCPTYYQYIWDSQWRYHNDHRTIYIMNRTTGVIQKIENPFGVDQRGNIDDVGGISSGWWARYRSGDGRLLINGYYLSYIVDKAGFVAVTNAQYLASSSGDTRMDEVQGLIQNRGANLYRNQHYIASINNLSEPVVKTSDKTMKIMYTIEFVSEEENNG